MGPSSEQETIGNLLLARIAHDEWAALRPHATRLTVEHFDALINPREPIRYVYFPVNCLASLVTVLEDGSSIEAGTIGREGMAGIAVVLDAETTPMQTLVQIPGDAIRISAAAIKEVFAAGKTLQKILHRYIHTLFVIASQSAACNRRHQIEARFARWLLMSSDGIGSDELAITHEFLSAMLGVRRSGVTEAAVKLQEEGMIRYKRGGIRIINRRKLESVACECYDNVKQEYDRLFR
jgi:CRP-like cAMP-binding protein